MASEEGMPYATARALDRALADRLANAAESSPYGIPELRRQFAYGRLLTRVFLDQPESWVLKGATGLLARLPGQARHSMDVDLYYAGEIDSAIEALRAAVEIDLGDFFTFDIERGPALRGVTVGSQLRAIAYLGDKVFETFRIDVVVSHTMTAEPESTPPIEPVEIPGLRSASYRVYPVADQIADKHGAIIKTYAGRASTRYRDLVDLVLIATTQTISAGRLHPALVSEHRPWVSGSPGPLTLPSGEWHEGYRKIAATVPDFYFLDATEAVEIVRRLVDPVLAGLATGIWDPVSLEWT